MYAERVGLLSQIGLCVTEARSTAGLICRAGRKSNLVSSPVMEGSCELMAAARSNVEKSGSANQSTSCCNVGR